MSKLTIDFMESKQGNIMPDRSKMRSGYTTGTCAQAASKAAALSLLADVDAEEIRVRLPGQVSMRLKIEQLQKQYSQGRKISVTCAVRKDSGDDPDVTNGVLVYSTVSFGEKTDAKDAGAMIHLDGGVGIGRVTKPGLDQPVGMAAINRIPRIAIEESVQEVCTAHGYSGGLNVVISIPDGVELAKKTFNPRLGIVGGISVLGTTGIVEPMSEQALIDTIQVEIRVKRAAGGEYLLAVPGNYGLAFLNSRYGMTEEEAVKCSNYAGETIDMASESGAKGLLFVSHIGKGIKLAGGIMNTHSRYADGRMEISAAAMLRAGIDSRKARQALDCMTMDDVIGILSLEERHRFMDAVLRQIQKHLKYRAGDGLLTGAVLFSNVYGVLGMTENAELLLEKLKEQKHRTGRI